MLSDFVGIQAIARLMSLQLSCVFAAISSGNHGQGLALACRLTGATAHIVMPKPFSAMEHRAVLGYGAQVHVVENRNCAETKFRELVGDFQAVVAHPFNDSFVTAGQGAVMVEFVDHVADLDIMLAPVAVEACSPSSVSRLCLPIAHRHLMPVSRPAPWMRWIRSSRTVPACQ